MGRPILDRTGKRYGRLVALYVAAQTLKKQAVWMCQCNCGNKQLVAGGCLTRGTIRSCGCLVGDARRAQPIKSLADRFWSRVQKADGCWEWQGAIDPKTGYGRIGAGRNKDGVKGAHV